MFHCPDCDSELRLDDFWFIPGDCSDHQRRVGGVVVVCDQCDGQPAWHTKTDTRETLHPGRCPR